MFGYKTLSYVSTFKFTFCQNGGAHTTSSTQWVYCCYPRLSLPFFHILPSDNQEKQSSHRPQSFSICYTVGLLLLPHSHLLQSSFIFYLIFPSPIPIYCSLPKKPFHASPSSELRSSPPLQISYCFSLTHNPYFISTHSKSLFFFPPTHSLGSIAQQPFKRIHVHAYKITKTTPTTSLIYTSMAISYSKLPSLSQTHCHFYFPNSKKPIPISH